MEGKCNLWPCTCWRRFLLLILVLENDIYGQAKSSLYFDLFSQLLDLFHHCRTCWMNLSTMHFHIFIVMTNILMGIVKKILAWILGSILMLSMTWGMKASLDKWGNILMAMVKFSNCNTKVGILNQRGELMEIALVSLFVVVFFFLFSPTSIVVGNFSVCGPI